ncbi:hypothetical protein GW17_00042205 [Ensete ventricosum]|nr:hypothetical protein GW17_00042205 [Ensete ventricosum]
MGTSNINIEGVKAYRLQHHFIRASFHRAPFPVSFRDHSLFAAASPPHRVDREKPPPSVASSPTPSPCRRTALPSGAPLDLFLGRTSIFSYFLDVVSWVVLSVLLRPAVESPHARC